MNSRLSAPLKWAAGAASVCLSFGGLTQSPGVWDVKGVPGKYCLISTGYDNEEGASGYKGIKIFAPIDHPRDLAFVFSINPEERRVSGIEDNAKDIDLHLTFGNPDLGNAFIVVRAEATTMAAPAGGLSLVGPIEPEDAKLLSKYRWLDVYDANTNAHLRRISLTNSTKALEHLQDCIRRRGSAS
jgi:hypothetical protein